MYSWIPPEICRWYRHALMPVRSGAIATNCFCIAAARSWVSEAILGGISLFNVRTLFVQSVVDVSESAPRDLTSGERRCYYTLIMKFD